MQQDYLHNQTIENKFFHKKPAVLKFGGKQLSKKKIQLDGRLKSTSAGEEIGLSRMDLEEMAESIK
jgi:hypothetical protein